MAINKGYLTAKTTSDSDECLTPKYVVKPIIKYIKEKGFKKIWCPFDLDHSNYVQVFLQQGFKVINTHIQNGNDFFNVDINFDFDCIVSNPPFSLKDKILERLYEIKKPFAVLLPIPTLQSKDRVPMFIKNGLQLLTFDKRAGFLQIIIIQKLSLVVLLHQLIFAKICFQKI